MKFHGGHGMEVASKFDVHFDKTGGKFVGKERMLAADKLFGGKAPWIGY